MAKVASQKIPVFDVYFASYQILYGVIPELRKHGTKVVFEFEPSLAFFELAKKYQSGGVVNAVEFSNSIRRLRAQMLTLRNENGGGSRAEKMNKDEA